MLKVQIWVARRGEYLDEAATIWAEATAARDGDGDGEIAPLSLARPVIQRVTESSLRSLLFVALEASNRVVGFAAVEAVPADERTAEVRYLGVRPDSWGGGVGRQLMLALPSRLAAAGFTRGELSVYVDNPRAVQLYERLGWLPYGDPTPHPRNGCPEQRYRLDFLVE